MELPSFQYQSLAGSNQIRLITILPQERGSVVKLGLEHAEMNSDPKYECLSYAWETDDRDRSITINDSSFLVSSTLHVALEHLRHTSQERKIWIDAICINQTDIAERNSQVAIMRKIYRNAMRVIIWIGPATESSEQAMAFLKMMATAKKNDDRNTWRNGCRVVSDTSSELGPGESWSPWRPPSAPHGSDEQADVQEGYASIEPHDKAISRDEGSISSHVASLDREADERPLSLRSAGALCDGANQVNGPTQWEKLKVCLINLYTSLKWRCNQRKRLRANGKAWREYVEAHDTMQATKNNVAITGYPILCNMFGNPYDEYFKNEWESHWQALDELLARPWWGRTWVVQEIWCASDAVLQCGDTTIKWKTFQKAMDYSEAWDDMGDHVKGMERQLQWETLRQRYTLAIHLTKARVNGSTLSSLLWSTWDRASTDPRDKVFVMLALVGEAKTSL